MQRSQVKKDRPQLGMILEIKKSYQRRILELLLLNSGCFWAKRPLPNTGGFYMYTTHSWISLKFALNFVLEIPLLTVNEPSPPISTLPQSTKSQTLSTIKYLIWEENGAVQKKYGSRYRKLLPKFHRQYPFPVNCTREKDFLRKRAKVGEIQLKGVVWNKNLMTKNFFFFNFWQKANSSGVLMIPLFSFTFFSFYYLILLRGYFKFCSMLLYLTTLKNNAHSSSTVR